MEIIIHYIIRGEKMNIFDMFFKKERKSDTKRYLLELEKKLDEAEIPYEIEENEDGNHDIRYIDPFNKTIYKFGYADNRLTYREREITEDDAYQMIKARWETDSLTMQYMDDEEYTDIFDILEFFSDITSSNGLIGRMVPLKDGKGINLYYNIGKTPTERSYLIGIGEYVKKGKVSFQILPSRTETDVNGATLNILKKIYDEAPLFFSSGTYKVKGETRFTDIVKTYLINLAIVNRLNEVEDVEAQITDVGKNNIIFVMFKNGSALEYISPTKQNPLGKLLLIDYDEDNTIEDNNSFQLVSNILKLPSMIKDKPDEKKMPERKFANSRNESQSMRNTAEVKPTHAVNSPYMGANRPMSKTINRRKK